VTRVAQNCSSAKPTADTSALEDVFARCQAELLGTLFYLVGNLEDARDALQETFIKCWRHQDQLVDVQNVKAWVFRIALNTGRDVRQTAWRRKRQPLPDDESMMESRQRGPHSQAAEHEQLEMIQLALRGLDGDEQEVFLLRQNGDMTYEEIADALGVPTGTVKTRMRRALMKLREALAET
jgi:RNA polymerase sigma factor (sigma-70 family)